MRFSIAIPTLRGADRIKQLINSLLLHTPRCILDDAEIVISDDMSEHYSMDMVTEVSASETEEYCKSITEVEVKYTRPDKWQYFAGNWNNAVCNCTHETIMFLLCDSVITGNDWCIEPLNIASNLGFEYGVIALPHIEERVDIKIPMTQSKSVEINTSWPRPFMIMRKSIWDAMGRYNTVHQMVENQYSYYCYINGLDMYYCYANYPIIHQHHNSVHNTAIFLPLEIRQSSPQSLDAWKLEWGKSYKECFDEIDKWIIGNRSKQQVDLQYLTKGIYEYK